MICLALCIVWFAVAKLLPRPELLPPATARRLAKHYKDSRADLSRALERRL